MKLHVVDGTYELFRAYYGVARDLGVRDGGEQPPTAAVARLVQSLLMLLRREQVTHIGVAFDHVIESFRNDLFDGYKSSAGVPEDLLAQFPLAEEAVDAMGMVGWAMIEFEADDAMATAVARWADADGMEQIVVCSPDKDLSQLVRGDRVVTRDRMRDVTMDEAAVVAKFGVPPAAIPDYLALVGDSADGIPGVPRWGAKSAATVLARYGSLDDIPADPDDWDVTVRGKQALADNLRQAGEDVRLYRMLATLRSDVPLAESLQDLGWDGVPREAFMGFCSRLGAPELTTRPHRWRGE